jgi:hypothetical protein
LGCLDFYMNDADRIEGFDAIVEQGKFINELPRQALWWGPFTDTVTEQIRIAIQDGTSADEVVDNLAAEWDSLRAEFE